MDNKKVEKLENWLYENLDNGDLICRSSNEIAHQIVELLEDNSPKRRQLQQRKPRRLNSVVRWGGLWREDSRLDGRVEHLLFEHCLPALFRTRREARAFIAEHYGYIAERADLRAEPFGWKMPIPVRVTITANDKLRHGEPNQ